MIVGKRVSQPGFTLVELLITLFIMGILATIAIPGFQTLIASNRQATSFNEILGGFKLARSEAITRREDVTAKLEPQNDSGWSLKIENEDEKTILSLDSSGDSVDVSDELEVTFNSLGRRESCVPNECQVDIGSEKLEISLTGRVGKPNDSDEQKDDGENQNDGDDD